MELFQKNIQVIALFGRQSTLGHMPHGIYEAYVRKSHKTPGREVTDAIQSSTTDMFRSQAGQSLRRDLKITPLKNTHRTLRFRLLTIVVL